MNYNIYVKAMTNPDPLPSYQNISWEGTLESGNYTLFYGEGNTNPQLGTGFFVHR